ANGSSRRAGCGAAATRVSPSAATSTPPKPGPASSAAATGSRGVTGARIEAAAARKPSKRGAMEESAAGAVEIPFVQARVDLGALAGIEARLGGARQRRAQRRLLLRREALRDQDLLGNRDRPIRFHSR